MHRVIRWRDDDVGLDAVLVIDDVTLGPAAGGVRTRAYDGHLAALADAAALASAMTLKCALAGLDAGGGKCVVRAHPGLADPARRTAMFAALGARIDKLDGLFRTAGDLGTTAADLAAMASRCRFVHTDDRDLAVSVARGLLRCVEACAATRGSTVAGLHVAVQGCGAIGAAVAHVLGDAGARLTVADLDAGRARALADATGAAIADPAAILGIACDVIAPCAIGGVLDISAAEAVRAWAVCGAANNLLASPAAEEVLVGRGILVVPDVVASAGAVIEGIGRTVMGLADRTPLIDALGATAGRILDEAGASGERPTAVADRLARARIESARKP